MGVRIHADRCVIDFSKILHDSIWRGASSAAWCLIFGESQKAPINFLMRKRSTHARRPCSAQSQHVLYSGNIAHTSNGFAKVRCHADDGCEMEDMCEMEAIEQGGDVVEIVRIRLYDGQVSASICTLSRTAVDKCSHDHLGLREF